MKRSRAPIARVPASRRRTPSPSPASRPARAPGARRPRLLVLAAAAAAVWMTGALATQYARTYALAREAARMDRHRRDLTAENAALREEIHRLKTDDGYIEWLARKELGLVRPGEVEFMLVPPGGAQAEASAPPPAPARSASRAADGPGAAGDTERAPGAIAAPGPGVMPAPAREANWVARLAERVASLLHGLHR